MPKSGSPLELTTLAAIPLVMVLGNSMIVPVLPTMERELNLSQFQVSLMITAFSFAAGLIIPFVGYLSDRFGRKVIIVPALILYGIGGIIAGLAAWLMDNAYNIILIARIIQGIGAAGTAPIAMALIGDLYSGSKESKALGLIEATNGLGKVLSPILGSLLALLIWYAVFFAFPALCFLTALAVWFLIKEKNPAKPKPLKQYLASLKQVFKEQGGWLVTAFFVGSIGLFILFGVLFYLSDILETEYKLDGVIKGAILAIPLMGMVTTAYITGGRIKQNKPLMRKIMLTGLSILTASMIAVGFFKQIYVMIGLLTLGSIGTGLLLPCLNTLITGSVAKSERGMITSLYNSLRFLGVAVGPPVFSWLMGISHQTLFFSVAGLAALTFLLTFFFIKPGAKNKKGTGKTEEPTSLFKKVPAK
ncbi:MFS transporter [Ammoniphilus sp. CFH 90114]|uniref:MFS transporter n=1 Tax=Ammoniphilus sp. CFH 90114 TaxID=2493665 RepID=UPI00100E184A|nr:MFS transporter [Ammoniphilus sp. CFH 90114]RXT14926.1 MFS transporter [Ammoniphilus sp. CFH 90114]